MKKILTLAIALVMVFAIAAPAFASGWDVEIPEIELKDLTLKIQALATEKSSNTTWNGGSGYAVLEKTYPVIAGTKVHAVVTVTVPASANLSKAMKAYMTNGQAQVKIETSNLENVKVKAVYTSNDKAYFNETLTGTKITKALASSDILEKGATITFEITANAEKSDKDAKMLRSSAFTTSGQAMAPLCSKRTTKSTKFGTIAPTTSMSATPRLATASSSRLIRMAPPRMPSWSTPAL